MVALDLRQASKGKAMQDIPSMIRQLNRPRLLVQAARFGVDGYRREMHLRRLLGRDRIPGPAEAARRLMDREADMEAARRDGRADYSFARHVEVLIALLGEARILRASGPLHLARRAAPVGGAPTLPAEAAARPQT